MFWKRSFDGLDALVAERGSALLATAVLLTGSRAAGEDLLQGALERLMRSWGRVREDPERYLRRTMYHLAVDQWRLRRRRAEVFAAAEPQGQSDAADAVALRQVLMQALAQLPPRQRAVLVLRYWEQLSEAEAAEVLGCSVGTVKSTASRGLSRLREMTATWDIHVIVNADGRIAKVTLDGHWQSTVKGRLDSGSYRAVLELSEYGLAVHVERPKDVVPAN